MANTLETKTIEQLHTALVSYNSYMCEIPDSFPVLSEYLHGLTDTYTYLNEHPESIGLTARDRKNGEWKVQSSQHISCIKKLLYVLG